MISTYEPHLPGKEQAPDFLNQIFDEWDLLSVIETPNTSVDEAAADLGMILTRAKSIQSTAKDLSSLRSRNGEFRHSFMEFTLPNSTSAIRSIIPIQPNHPYDHVSVEFTGVSGIYRPRKEWERRFGISGSAKQSKNF
jgi:hypothetical protein